MLSIMILGHTPRALLKRYAPTTWRRCKHGVIEEFSSAEDVGPSEAIQRKFWRKNTAMVAADSTDVSHGGLPKRAPGRSRCAPFLKSRFWILNIPNLCSLPFIASFSLPTIGHTIASFSARKSMLGLRTPIHHPGCLSLFYIQDFALCFGSRRLFSCSPNQSLKTQKILQPCLLFLPQENWFLSDIPILF